MKIKLILNILVIIISLTIILTSISLMFFNCNPIELIVNKSNYCGYKYKNGKEEPVDTKFDIRKYRLDKPAIYLYPISTQKIKVSLNINGSIIKSIPEYKNGWEVIATSQSIIDNKFDYLFYENTLNKLELPNEFWVVKSSNLDNWFTKNLPLLGLNKKETQQFKEYWLAVLNKSDYYQIKLLDKDFLNQNVKLTIDPKPDSIIRLIFYFKPLKNEINYKEPKIITPIRNGFTVVEWGGTLE